MLLLYPAILWWLDLRQSQKQTPQQHNQKYCNNRVPGHSLSFPAWQIRFLADELRVVLREHFQVRRVDQSLAKPLARSNYSWISGALSRFGFWNLSIGPWNPL